jgi:sulfite exporter TauE/SafE
MTDPTGTVALSAALIAGLAGSGHCVAMCGSLAGALSAHSTASNRGLGDVAVYQMGRLVGYASAGAVFGAFGDTIRSMVDLPQLATVLRVAAGLLLILIAVRLSTGVNPLLWLERGGAIVWRSLRPLTQHALRVPGAGRRLLIGLLWGWLPCGLVYSALLYAALSGSWVSGAKSMLAFGLGTLPAMLATHFVSARAMQRLNGRGGRLLSAAILAALGVWLVWASARSLQHVGHVATLQAEGLLKASGVQYWLQ